MTKNEAIGVFGIMLSIFEEYESDRKRARVLAEIKFLKLKSVNPAWVDEISELYSNGRG
jgi:hypothetical protein